MDSSDTTKPTKPLLDQSPIELFWNRRLYQWDGFWYASHHLEAALAFRSQFIARDDDVLLASSMKTGSTWLKALCFTILHRTNKLHDNDPLLKNPPAFYVKTLEVQVYTEKPLPDLSGMPSPRLFHTHMPYSSLPDSVKNSGCKIVYITRNPKDTFVSLWHFLNRIFSPMQETYPLEKAFESFCNGVCPAGPFFDQVLQYWNESLKMPNKILFMKYEDLKRDPKGEVKKLASFLGRSFGSEEEVDEILWRCSLKRLKNLEVNKDGNDHWINTPNSAYFRNGIVGDWKSLLTPEMSDRLDQIAKQKLEGSGLSLEI